MASTRIFLTGASGYIGGDILHALWLAHPEYKLRVLVRDDTKATAISKAYADVHIVKGDLDSTSLIEEEASQTDIVVHAASSSHINSVGAIARGLSCRNNSTPAHWIQVSGASVLSISDIVAGRYGEGTDKVFSDVDGAQEVRDIIDKNSNKRVVDHFLLNLAGPKTALVFPPIIYGQGRGVVKQRSVQIPELSRVTIETKTRVQVGKGESTWSNVHISDVSAIFVKLVEKAVHGEDEGLWNKDGLYFPGNGTLTFGQISQKVAQAAKDLGLIDSTAVKELDHDEADKLSPHGAVLWGTNAQQNSQRARQLLGWQPRGRSLQEEVPETVQVEAVKLGKLGNSFRSLDFPHLFNQRISYLLSSFAAISINSYNARQIRQPPFVITYLIQFLALKLNDRLEIHSAPPVAHAGGLSQCRRRHVKCDQKRPVCRTCQTLGVPCEGFSNKVRWIRSSGGSNETEDHHGIRRHLYIEQLRESMSTSLGSNLVSGSISASLAEIDLRTRDPERPPVGDFVIGPFAVLDLAPDAPQGMQHGLPGKEAQELDPGQAPCSPPQTVPSDPVVSQETPIEQTLLMNDSSHIDDFLHWSDILGLSPEQPGFFQPSMLDLDMYFGAHPGPDTEPQAFAISEATAPDQSNMAIMTSPRSGIEIASTFLDAAVLADAPSLFKHFNENVVPQMMIMPLCDKFRGGF